MMEQQMDRGHQSAGYAPSLSRQIDLMKGIAILLIIAFHLGGQVLKTAPESAYRILTCQGVQVFFIMSGFTLRYAQLERNSSGIAFSWKQWIMRRFIRIYPLYFLVLFFTLAVSLSGAKVIKVSKISMNIFADFFMHATMLHIFSLRTFWSMNVALWFVGVITGLYLLFPFLNRVLYRWNNPLRLWCISLLLYFTAVMVKTMTAGPFDVLKPAYISPVMSRYSSFVAGLAIYTVVVIALAYFLTRWEYRVKKLLNRFLIEDGSLAESSRDLAGKGAV